MVDRMFAPSRHNPADQSYLFSDIFISGMLFTTSSGVLNTRPLTNTGMLFSQVNLTRASKVSGLTALISLSMQAAASLSIKQRLARRRRASIPSSGRTPKYMQSIRCCSVCTVSPGILMVSCSVSFHSPLSMVLNISL